MEAGEIYEFTITLSLEERGVFAALVRKLHERPRAVGFVKADFSPDEKDMIRAFYGLFEYPDTEQHTKVLPATHTRQVVSDE